MKVRLIIGGASLVVGLLVGIGLDRAVLAPGYSFHTGQNGALMWRTDRRSGATWLSLAGKPWKQVEDSVTFP